MKVLIIEDELDARNVVKLLLKKLFPGQFNIVGCSGTISESLTLIKEKKPELVFLDVRLEDGLGLEILQKLDKINFHVIFTTAYDNYAIKAIKYAAIDYLLKPINPEEFDIAVQKALDKKQKFGADHSIAIKTAEQTHFVPCNKIIRLEADGSYTLIVTSDNKIFASKNLKYFENILPDTSFIRTHQSHLINIKHVKSIKNDLITLNNNDKIPVSFRKKTGVMNFLKDKN